MKLKKILALTMALVMLLGMAACGSKKTVWKDFDVSLTTESVTLVGENGCTITIAPVEYTNGFAELSVAFQNNTQELQTLELAGFAINGMMVDFYLSISAEAGQTVYDTLGADLNHLRMKGIFEIATIDLQLFIADEVWQNREAFSCQLKTPAAKNFKADDRAYLRSLTSKQAQEALGYTIVDKLDERADLGNGVFLESKVFKKSGTDEVLLLELVNEADAMRQVSILTDSVNGMQSSGAGDSFNIFPGAKAVFTIDMEWALPATMREAFDVKNISKVTMYCDVYHCDQFGEQDWDYEIAYQNLEYTVPGTSATPNTTGVVVYDKQGLKITAKPPVLRTLSEDLTESYVYLTFENTGESDLYVGFDEDREPLIDGATGPIYFKEPYFLGVGDTSICHLEVDNMSGGSVVLPLYVRDYDNTENNRWFDILVDFH